MTTFTPYISFAGGMMIGLAVVILMACHGRVLGATGILSGLMRLDDLRDWSLRAALVIGMIAAPCLVYVVTGAWPKLEVPVSMTAIAGGGLLAGIGVSYGGGCTSGHGVCGNARFSRRSITATISFMMAAFVTVYITRHLIGA